MPQHKAGFPYWEVIFDEHGQLEDPAQADTLLAELPGEALTDLFVFSHGWNNDRTMARDLYERYFGEMQALLADPATRRARPATIGILGVLWPSLRWADEAPPAPAPGGAAGIGRRRRRRPADSRLAADLKAVFTAPEQQRALDEMVRLLRRKPRDEAALERFQALLATLTAGSAPASAPEDNGEQASILEEPTEDVFEHFATLAPRRRGGGGAAGLDDVFGRLWTGAREALRAASYWQMKHRAGIVGQQGLGPLLTRLHAAQADLRLHLLGHSFGGRVVSFALAGLPAGTGVADPSPVKSLGLIQAAFSHFAFADALPHDAARGGALAGMARRVDGPIFVVHSDHDAAVGTLYPLASLAGRDDAAAAGDRLFRWGALGHDGAQAVPAEEDLLGPVGVAYAFQPGGFVNLDGDDIVKIGGPPAGAHGDIFHPEIAWATLTAAGIAAPT